MVKMVKVTTECHICEICGEAFETKEAAEKCEAKGVGVWEELEIGSIIMRSWSGQESGQGINQAVVVGLVAKGHDICPVIVSLDNPEPRNVDMEDLAGSYIIDDEEMNNLKWLFERSDQIREKINTEEK